MHNEIISRAETRCPQKLARTVFGSPTVSRGSLQPWTAQELPEAPLQQSADPKTLQLQTPDVATFCHAGITAVGVAIIIITSLEPALQKPMYFFLANFSSLEICYVSVTLPRMLFNLWTQDRSISLLDCATQMCFFLMLGTTECFLLAVMSYDRYVAICNPLHYPLVMNHKMCVQLAVGSWVSGIPVQIGQTWQIFSLHFCNSNLINHFFCDIPPILKLACGDTSVHEVSVYAVVMLVAAVPFMLILASYSKIISTILRLPTATGRAKAFSTCSSHLLVVVLFFGSGTITYLRPKSNHSAGTDKLLSLFYTMVTPMFNPMIYSLRNKDFIAALRKLFLNRMVH